MGNIKVLDCTLRDGGYVNNWNFGKLSIDNIITQLLSSKVDVIECGFLSQTKETDENKSILRNIDDVTFECTSKEENTLMVLMMNYGEYNIDDLPPYDGGLISGIRLAFHKKIWYRPLKSVKNQGKGICDICTTNGYSYILR